jgi:hypothetical protein
LGADTVAEAVKARLGKTGGEAEPVEAVREQVGSGVTLPLWVQSSSAVG